jgi:hypothetical protein
MWWAMYLASATVVAVVAAVLAAGGFRAGDHAGDVKIRAEQALTLTPAGLSVIGVRVVAVNPGIAAALVGLTLRSERRWERLFREPVTVAVPWFRRRRRYYPSRQVLVGVVGAGSQAQWQLSWPQPYRPGSIRVTAVIGQTGRRLRVIDHRVAAATCRGARHPRPAGSPHRVMR